MLLVHYTNPLSIFVAAMRSSDCSVVVFSRDVHESNAIADCWKRTLIIKGGTREQKQNKNTLHKQISVHTYASLCVFVVTYMAYGRQQRQLDIEIPTFVPVNRFKFISLYAILATYPFYWTLHLLTFVIVHPKGTYYLSYIYIILPTQARIGYEAQPCTLGSIRSPLFRYEGTAT